MEQSIKGAIKAIIDEADKIEQVVKHCERGRMSSFEAVRTIMDIQSEYDEQPWVL